MTIIIQENSATPVSALSASVTHKQYARAVVSEYDASQKTTTFWVADHMVDDTSATEGHVYCFTIKDGDAAAQLIKKIALPKISKDNSALNLATDLSVDAVAQPNFLRLSKKYVWVPDFNTGAIYRFKKSNPDANAEIVFFKPAKNNNRDQFHQWYDIGLQPKKDGAKARIIVVDGSRDSDDLSLYSIEMDDLDGDLKKNAATHNTLTDFTQTLPLSLLGKKPDQFCDIAVLGDKIWLYLYDDRPEKCAVLRFGIDDDKIAFEIRIDISGANGMTASPDNQYIIVGCRDGKLYRLDNNSQAGEVKPLTQTQADPETAYRLTIDKAGYIWTANKNHKLCCYTALGNLARKYTVKVTGGTDNGEISIIGMAMIGSGDRLVLADNERSQAVILTVDPDFQIQNADLAFTNPNGEYDTDSTINTVPLVAYTPGTTTRYSKPVGARLQTASVNGSKATATFSGEKQALVTVPVSGNTGTATVGFKTGVVAGQVDLLAEARTTGRNAVHYTLKISPSGTITVTPNITPIIIRQGKKITPDKTLTSSNGKEITVKAKDGTSSVTLGSDSIKSGKKLPAITAGKKTATTVITTKTGNNSGPDIKVQVVAVPVTIAHRALSTAGDSAQTQSIIDAVNRIPVTAKGYEILDDKNSTSVPAAYSYIKFKLVLSSENTGSLHFKSTQTSKDVNIKVGVDGLSAVVKANENGVATLHDAGIALEKVASKAFSPDKGINQITFEIDTSDESDATKFTPPTGNTALQLIVSH